MSLATPWPLRGICEPHATNDVLLSEHEGEPVNPRLLQFIESRKAEFDQKSRLEKPLVAVEILKLWRKDLDPPGRFLLKDDSTLLWKDVGDKKARAYISKLLKQESVGSDQGCSQTNISTGVPGPLDWKGVATKLYEREEQAQKLIDAYERSKKAATPPELILICGPSGSGKSELAKSTLEDHVTSQGGFFLCGFVTN